MSESVLPENIVILQKPNYTGILNSQSELHQILVTYVPGPGDILIRFLGQRSESQQTSACRDPSSFIHQMEV